MEEEDPSEESILSFNCEVLGKEPAGSHADRVSNLRLVNSELMVLLPLSPESRPCWT